MFCTQCGSKIADGFKFCPECGGAVTGGSKQNREETLEDLIKNIVKEYPPKSTEPVAKISRTTGLSKLQVGFLVAHVRDGVALSGIKDYRVMEQKYKNFKQNDGTLHCPKCGSHNLQYKQGSTWAFTSGSITMIDNPRTSMKCVDCGKQWVESTSSWRKV